MFTVFVFAKLWHRSGLHTDLEFYELRYSGKPAAFLRGFGALYLGTFFNIIIMAVVTLAAIKISHVMLGLDAMTTVIVACVDHGHLQHAGGLTSVLWVDAFMFVVAMVGSIAAAVVAVRERATSADCRASSRTPPSSIGWDFCRTSTGRTRRCLEEYDR